MRLSTLFIISGSFTVKIVVFLNYESIPRVISNIIKNILFCIQNCSIVYDFLTNLVCFYIACFPGTIEATIP